jgi:hypothetical protein
MTTTKKNSLLILSFLANIGGGGNWLLGVGVLVLLASEIEKLGKLTNE